MNVKNLHAGLILFTLAIGCIVGKAQVISGSVLNENNEPLPAAIITNEQTGESVNAGAEGGFSIMLADGQSLSVSCMGYQTKKDIIPAGQSVIIRLKKSSGEMQYFIGYSGLGLASTGLSGGVWFKKQFGIFISYRSNKLFRAEPAADGKLTSEATLLINNYTFDAIDYFNLSGEKEYYRSSVLAGVIFKLYKSFSGYAAFGIGNYSVFRTATESASAARGTQNSFLIKDENMSKGPFENEVGVIFKTRWFYLSAGCNVLNFSMPDYSFGAGVVF